MTEVICRCRPTLQYLQYNYVQNLEMGENVNESYISSLYTANHPEIFPYNANPLLGKSRRVRSSLSMNMRSPGRYLAITH